MREYVVKMNMEEMPKSCDDCDIAIKYQRFGIEIWCPFFGWYTDHDKCPILCQLPEGHGRLADKDLLMRDLDFLNTFGTPDDGKELSYEDILVTIDDFPTIVPADAERSEP